MQLTEEQQEIADQILARRSSCSLAGLAGTGKTTLTKYMHDKLKSEGKSVAAIAPTGKARTVLESKGVPATTIHKAIYNFFGKFWNDQDELELVFKDNHGGRFCDVLFVDETSMVTLKQQKDIESRGIKTIWVGDPGQLPPVKSKNNTLLSAPDYKLTQIHRQAADNPIIKWAYALRRGLPLRETFNGITHIDVSGRGASFIALQMLKRGIDRVIVKTNKQRVALNNAIRAALGHKGSPVPGDQIICVANNYHAGMMNGELFTVVEVQQVTSVSARLVVRSNISGMKGICNVWLDQFGLETTLDREEVDEDIVLADWGYALTCHKMQGSSEKNIAIIDKGYCGNMLARWNYTAATRAEEGVVVFC